MSSLIAAIAGLWLAVKAETDAQKITGGAILAAAPSSSFHFQIDNVMKEIGEVKGTR